VLFVQIGKIDVRLETDVCLETICLARDRKRTKKQEIRVVHRYVVRARDCASTHILAQAFCIAFQYSDAVVSILYDEDLPENILSSN